jgi:hypothetical protein
LLIIDVGQDGHLFQSVLIPLLVVIFLVWIWFGTYYETREDYLLIRSGPIWQRIRYERIRAMKKSSKPWSSAALSLKRIEIRHGKMGYTLISPVDRDAFLKEMKRRCPNARIEG